MKCSICEHGKLVEIDSALLAGRSLRDIAGQYVVTKSALSRHKREHAPFVSGLGTAAGAGEVESPGIDPVEVILGAEDPSSRPYRRILLKRAEKVYASLDRVRAKGEAENRPEVVIKAAGVQIRGIEVEGRLTGAINEGAEVNVQIGIVMPRPVENAERHKIVDISETR